MAIEKYQPSNGTEGAAFQSAYCDNCKHDNFDHDTCTGGCEILAKTMICSVDDPEYPSEWRLVGGKPTCTAFEATGTPDRCDRTIDFLEL